MYSALFDAMAGRYTVTVTVVSMEAAERGAGA